MNSLSKECYPYRSTPVPCHTQTNILKNNTETSILKDNIKTSILKANTETSILKAKIGLDAPEKTGLFPAVPKCKNCCCD